MRYKLVVVEDKQQHLTSCRDVLRKYGGIDAVFVSDLHALRKALTEKVDIALSDVMFPRGQGQPVTYAGVVAGRWFERNSVPYAFVTAREHHDVNVLHDFVQLRYREGLTSVDGVPLGHGPIFETRNGEKPWQPALDYLLIAKNTKDDVIRTVLEHKLLPFPITGDEGAGADFLDDVLNGGTTYPEAREFAKRVVAGHRRLV